jgi:hypothetical protein
MPGEREFLTRYFHLPPAPCDCIPRDDFIDLGGILVFLSFFHGMISNEKEKGENHHGDE